MLALVWRPGLVRSGPAPALDTALLAVLAATLLQVLPMPRPIVGLVVPAAEHVSQALNLVDPGRTLSLSIRARDTAAAAALFAGIVGLFVTARTIFERGGARTTVRGVAWAGLALAAVGLAQDASAHGLMYWRWRPIDDGPAPFGPFVNRNHFATWALMAGPLVAGYAVAHAAARQGAGGHLSWPRRFAAWLDGRAILLVAAAVLLIVALAASLSRSGLIGLVAALACGLLLARTGSATATRGRSPRPVVLIGTVGGLALLLVLIRVGPGVIAERFAASGVAVADRVTIWRETLPILHDFWLTGTGAGTYQTAMIIYQRSSPGVLFNQAHNHYLQVAAEGGLLAGLPVVFTLWTFARAARIAVVNDRSRMYWVRAGAACGLVGAAVQSLLETGLTTPANGALAAILAAMVTHTAAEGAARLD
jgi:O-antigen ligase